MGDAPANIFAAVSAPASRTSELSLFVLAVTGAIFFVVFGLTIVAVVRFRRRDTDDGREPPQVYGSNQLETAWTVVPVLIVLVLALTTARVIQSIQGVTRPANAIDVIVIGHQWWWELRYPGLGIVTANELHVPVSDPLAPTPTWLTLLSADVAHSFWVPRLAGKTDLIPNRVNHMWIAPTAPGVYVGQCAEYCGTQHAKMLLRVYVHPRDEFERWAQAQRQGDPQVPSELDAVVAGRRVFESNACINCHSVAGTVGNGRYGPDLTHLMSRATLAAGAAPLSPETLRAWIRDPNGIKPGAHMPAMKLTEQQIDQLVQFLLTLH
ncbi:MAG: cytochrome c oxidase, subunit [Myxococcales bacterium]|nr:cytochrome c oxidase, subunit [Myxococcales bacterium]